MFVVMTAPDREGAIKIVRCLLNERLIACANIVGPISSLFRWEDKIEEASEYLVFMKSHENLFEKLAQRVKEMHNYQVPEVIALPIMKGLPSYLDWLHTCLELVGGDG